MVPCNYSPECPVLDFADYVPDILLTKNSNRFTNPSNLFAASEKVVTKILIFTGKRKS